jgi:hypothetical protein
MALHAFSDTDHVMNGIEDFNGNIRTLSGIAKADFLNYFSLL